MKYLLKNDIENAKYGRVLLNENKIYTKGFINANGYEYVDLGLPSGTLWAKCNVGAATPAGHSLYFQWGDTQGYYYDQIGNIAGKKKFSSDWSDYKFKNGDIDASPDYGMTKYNATDGKLVLDLEDDAAHVNMGGSWRMPTEEDFIELINNTDNEWIYFAEYNNEGRKFTSKTDSSKYIIFFPDVCRSDGGTGNNDCFILSATRDESVNHAANLIYTPEMGVYTSASDRYYGAPVRGIIKR